MWVRANPELFPKEVPGMSEELLAAASQNGGSLEEKIQAVVETFRFSARHLESLQQVLRKRALERRRDVESEEPFPSEVEEVIAQGTYTDAFLEAFDGRTFELYTEEIVPCHAYRLALEVHSGGAYWSSIPAEETHARQKVETVSASSSHEGSASIVSQFGAAQRGAVFVWRWQHLMDQGPYNVPRWLSRILGSEGNDPLRKLMGELESIQRWQEQVKRDTCAYVKQGAEVKDLYIREVLRLWPSETDAQGCENVKKCAWVEGLDPRLFVGRNVLVHKVQFDDSHSLNLHALISKRHSEEKGPSENNPPYRLATTWQWSAAMGSGDPSSAPGSVAVPARRQDGGLGGTATSLVDSLGGTASSLQLHLATVGEGGYGSAQGLSRPGTGASELTRPGTAMSVPTQPGSAAELLLPRPPPPAAAPGTPQAVAFANSQAAAASRILSEVSPEPAKCSPMSTPEALHAADASAGYVGADGHLVGPAALPPPPPLPPKRM